MNKNIVEVAKEQAETFGVRNIIVPTYSGKSARLVCEVFGSDYLIIAVGNPASAAAKGLMRGSGITDETKAKLETQGIKVVLRDQSLVQALAFGHGFEIGGKRFNLWGHHFGSASLQEVIEKAGQHIDFNAVAIIFKTLQLFDNGPRVCIETMLMAADSDVLPLDQDCLAVVRTPGDSPDVTMVMHPCKTEDLFNHPYLVVDLAMVHDEH